MERIHAEQIARLLNDQNQLTIPYTAETVLEHAPSYLVRIGECGEIIACTELKAVQWYQYELLHVTVAQTHLRGGLARSLIAEAEQQARLRGCADSSKHDPNGKYCQRGSLQVMWIRKHVPLL